MRRQACAQPGQGYAEHLPSCLNFPYTQTGIRMNLESMTGIKFAIARPQSGSAHPLRMLLHAAQCMKSQGSGGFIQHTGTASHVHNAWMLQ